MDDKLAVVDSGLAGLAKDLGSMERYLKARITQLNELVDSVDAGWDSPASATYKKLQKSVNDDAVRIRKTLILIEEAVKLGRDGFSAQDLEILRGFRRLQESARSERELLAPTQPGTDQPTEPPAGTQSKLDSY
ncbi:WXG100 family type VII secretion target [Streptomyces blastmyceticus]|uniref:WXG100 family type VII secretion target n=1 Tax=Streptomyces blastmyceticus TaxID=68180 RepID=A0ABN0WL11_9ACTN